MLSDDLLAKQNKLAKIERVQLFVIMSGYIISEKNPFKISLYSSN